jgi:hypothetical protein
VFRRDPEKARHPLLYFRLRRLNALFHLRPIANIAKIFSMGIDDLRMSPDTFKERGMSCVNELTDILRDLNLSEVDRQDVLRSLRNLADTGNQEAKIALTILEPTTNTTTASSRDAEAPLRGWGARDDAAARFAPTAPRNAAT